MPLSHFLAVAVVGLLPLVTARNDSLVLSQILQNPFPYDFPQERANGTAETTLFPMRLCHGFRLEEATIDDIQAQLSSGKLTSVQLLQCYYERIYQTDEYLKYGCYVLCVGCDCRTVVDTVALINSLLFYFCSVFFYSSFFSFSAC